MKGPTTTLFAATVTLAMLQIGGCFGPNAAADRQLGGRRFCDGGNAECLPTGSAALDGCRLHGENELEPSPCHDGHVYACCDAVAPAETDDGDTETDDDETDTETDDGDTETDGEDAALHGRVTEQNGDMTYYDLGLTACGEVYTNEDMVAAVAFDWFTTPNPNVDPMCGRRVRITDPETSNSVEVEIRDKCQACQYDDIDVSPAAFQVLQPLSVGRYKVTWDFV